MSINKAGLSAQDNTNILLTNSNHSMSLSHSVPCAPTGITTNLQCGTNALVVSWIRSAVALNYSVRAVPLAGNTSSASCVSAQSNCTLPALQCGWMYNISVKASSGSCSSPYSPPQTIHTGNSNKGNNKTIYEKCHT